MPAAMTASLDQRVVLDAPVRRIDQQDGNVIVTTDASTYRRWASTYRRWARCWR
jgi:hypothetical protein